MSEFQKQLIKAGAGTGKTEALVQKVYKLFMEQKFREERGREPRLIVCTFTRKASHELKERLFAFKNIKGKLNIGGVEEDFFQYVRSPSLYISTIDGILNLFLKRYGYRWDLSPDFQILQAPVNENLFDTMAQNFIFDKHFSVLQKLPYAYLKDLLIFYFKCRIKYGQISFYESKDFDKFNKQKRLWDSEETKELLKKPRGIERDFYKINRYFDKQKSPLGSCLNHEADLEKFKRMFNKEHYFNASLFVPLFKELSQIGEDFFSEFLEKKKKASELDINDLLLFSLALLQESPQTAKDFSKEWDYWLIDEYQDTNWLQKQIIQKITGFKNTFRVGDPGQSIYFFRGADPKVFQSAETSMQGQVKELTINRRSTGSLISFYNDFFSSNDVFLKIQALKNDFPKSEPCVHFFSYEKQKKQQAFQALFHYIEKLKANHFSEGDKIAILSSRNKDVEEIAYYLRTKGLSTLLYSSKCFTEKRLILDSLFLLKFIINPFDDNNLKALLRTPYFYMSDPELADKAYQQATYRKQNKIKISFWSFLLEKSPNNICVKSLIRFLELKNKLGIVKSFEKALMVSGMMELSYHQDATGLSESGLWKLLCLLNEHGVSALERFYSLMERQDRSEEYRTEPPSCDEGATIELMSIHKSKGLQFKHVIIMDFSIDQSGKAEENSFIYDESTQKMAFAVPEGQRDSAKVKSFGHAMYNNSRRKETLMERERLFYVAMTRAEQSLALFLPNNVSPQKNSWLERQEFFKIFSVSNQKLLNITDDKKKSPKWSFNPGDYQTDSYLLHVQSSESMCQVNEKSNLNNGSLKGIVGDQKNNTDSKILHEAKSKLHFEESQKKKTLPSIVEESQKKKTLPSIVEESQKKKTLPSIVEESQKKKTLPFIVMESSLDFKSRGKTIKSSRHFIDETEKEALPKKPAFILTKTQNILHQRVLGSYLHDFLQRSSYQPFEQVQTLVENSFLSSKDKEKIQQALIYITKLKEPPIQDFLKVGFSEWPFRLKKHNVILKGQIDLWAGDSKKIHLCDYKSSLSQFSMAQRQLIFYSGVLSEIYPTSKICMYQIYPFQKKVHQSFYSESHKNEFKTWLDNIHKK